MLRKFPEPADLPGNCCYGDGTEISSQTMDWILEAYQRLEIALPWQTGDVLMLDNLRLAHARNVYLGERKIPVVLADAITITGPQ